MTTALPSPSPELLEQKIVSDLETLRPQLRSIEVLHAIFNLDDLSKMSALSPAAFVTISQIQVEKAANGKLLANADLAILLTHKTKSNPWDLVVKVCALVSNQHWGFRSMERPQGLRAAPIKDAAQNGKSGAGLTAITWQQAFTLFEAPARGRNISTLENDRGEIIAENPNFIGGSND